ncbi:MAG: hypothetical protein JEZ06_14480 [Anaerolineaceae bacterium]|nr:hypothetical protein [Anaerolineaceae bacterium]
MIKPSGLGKVLWIVSIILLGITAAFHLMGGIGTTCVALGAEKYESMAGIVPFKWLYMIFVVTETAMAVMMIRATVNMIRKKDKSYKDALTILLIGLVLSGIHMFVSILLRGKSAPNNMRVYMNIFTLAIFLVLKIPGIWSKIYSGEGEMDKTNKAAVSGIAMIAFGLVVVSVQFWAGPTHTWGGINYSDYFHGQLTSIGYLLIALGLMSFVSMKISWKKQIQNVRFLVGNKKKNVKS